MGWPACGASQKLSEALQSRGTGDPVVTTLQRSGLCIQDTFIFYLLSGADCPADRGGGSGSGPALPPPALPRQRQGAGVWGGPLSTCCVPRALQFLRISSLSPLPTPASSPLHRRGGQCRLLRVRQWPRGLRRSPWEPHLQKALPLTWN